MNPGDSQARARFQSGLLTWLRAAAPQEHATGLREMIAVTRELAEAGSVGGDGLLWRSASSFLQALLGGTLDTDQEARSLCRRLERHLANRDADSRRDNAETLGQAIFAFVSNRLPSGDTPEPPATASGDASFNALMANAFSATADVLPLLGKTKPRRFSDQQMQRWKTAIAGLRHDWHAVQTGEQTNCRASAINFLQLALELADPPSLQLAEAFAEASGAAEEKTILAQPGFRAAFAAALEIAEHVDGPDQKGFADNAASLADRLAATAIAPKTSAGLVCASAPWFAEDAREVLNELAAALDAVPPQRLALLSGFDWFIQHESGKVMAIRGLATTAHKVIGQIRADDLDEQDAHTCIGRTIAALRQAVEELATGSPPHADEAVFAELRALDTRISAQRLAAIAAARAAQNEQTSPPASAASLQ